VRQVVPPWQALVVAPRRRRREGARAADRAAAGVRAVAAGGVRPAAGSHASPAGGHASCRLRRSWCPSRTGGCAAPERRHASCRPYCSRWLCRADGRAHGLLLVAVRRRRKGAPRTWPWQVATRCGSAGNSSKQSSDLWKNEVDLGWWVYVGLVGGKGSFEPCGPLGFAAVYFFFKKILLLYF
jgi:hypothetical protein